MYIYPVINVAVYILVKLILSTSLKQIFVFVALHLSITSLACGHHCVFLVFLVSWLTINCTSAYNCVLALLTFW